MEDIEKIEKEQLEDMTAEELADWVIDQNEKALWEQKRRKEVEAGAMKVATKLNAYEKLGKEEEKDPEDKVGEEDKEPTVAEAVKNQLEEEKVNEKLHSIIESIPEEYREVFQTTFNELKGDNKLTPANIDKITKASVALMQEDSDIDLIKAMAVGNNTGGGKQVSWQKKFAEDQKKLGMELFG